MKIKKETMKIPKNFKLGAHTIKVKFKPKLLLEKQALGDMWSHQNFIRLTKKDSRGNKLPKSQVLQTYYHEKVHHILYAMNSDLKNDEKFVDTFANLLLQTDLTSKK